MRLIMKILVVLCLTLLGCQSPTVTAPSITKTQVPDAPVGFAASALDGKVTVSWTAMSSATSFNLYWSTTSGVTPSNGTKVEIAGNSITSYTQSGLVNGTTYWFVLTAVNATGESLPCAQQSATPQVPIPLAPSGLSATAGDGKVILSWIPITGATEYHLYWTTSSAISTATSTMTLVPGGSTTTFTQTGLTGGTTYYFALTAVGAGGESPLSTAQSATPTIPVAGAPTGFTAAGGPGKVVLSWNASTGATGYNLYWSTSTGVTPSGGTRVTIPANTTTYTLSGLTNGTPYYFVLASFDLSGESHPCAQQSATPQVSPASTPTTFNASSADGQVMLSWNGQGDATGYNIYWSTSPGVTKANGNKISITSSGTTTFTHTGLTNGTSYYYVLTAINAGGESAASSQQVATPQVAAPDMPIGLSATGGAGQVSLSWNAVSGATGYTVYSWSTGFPTLANATKSTVSGGSSTNFVLTGLNAGSLYYFQLAATNAGGESVLSSSTSAYTLAPPSVPASFAATSGNGQAVLSWGNFGGTGFNIYWSMTPGVTTSNGTKISVTNGPYTHIGLANGTTYYYIITATNSAGESVASPQITACPRSFTNYTTSNGLAGNSISGVAVSGSTIVVATVGVSISTNAGTSWTNYTTTNGLGSNSVYGVAISGSNVVAATASGLSLSTNTGTSWSTYTTVDGLGANQINGVAISGSTILAATNGGGLSASTNGGTTWTTYKATAGLGDDVVYAAAISGSTYYAATAGGLSVSTNNGTTWTNYTTSQGLHDNIVYAVAVSGTTIYIGTALGVSASTNGGANWKKFSSANNTGPSNAVVGGITVSGSSVSVATASNGIFTSPDSGASWISYTTSNGLGSNQTKGVAISGSILYGATIAGLGISQ